MQSNLLKGGSYSISKNQINLVLASYKYKVKNSLA